MSGKDLARQSKALYAAAEKANYATVWAGQDSRMLCLSASSGWTANRDEGKPKVHPVLGRSCLRCACQVPAAEPGALQTKFDVEHVLQVLPAKETFIAVFENMDTVVFFNGKGYEGKIWQRLAKNPLPYRNIEGACFSLPFHITCSPRQRRGRCPSVRQEC